MFLVSLNIILRSNKWFLSKKISEPNLINYLDLVTLVQFVMLFRWLV